MIRLSKNCTCGIKGLSSDHYLLQHVGQFPARRQESVCQEVCVVVDVKGMCSPGYVDAAAKWDQYV